MSLTDDIRQRAAKVKKKVVLPEAEKDIRVLRAAVVLHRNKLADPLLLGNPGVILKMAGEHGVELPDEITIVPVDNAETADEKLLFLREKLAKKNPDEDQLKEYSRNPLYTGGWLVATGRADASVAGSVASTGEVIVSALRTVGIAAGSGLVSSVFLMEMPGGDVFTYADCAVVPYPDANQLATIAIDSGHTHRLITGEEPVVAFLSFSTKGSARHERADLVRQAYLLAKTRKSDWKMDGELQFDAARVPAIAERKAPGSSVGGNANVFIFPNLDAGNIAYKITERLAGATATGPVLQGLAKPYMDLSRGCSVEDIINTVCVAALVGR